MAELPNFKMEKRMSVHFAAQNMVARETSSAARLDLSLGELHNTVPKTI